MSRTYLHKKFMEDPSEPAAECAAYLRRIREAAKPAALAGKSFQAVCRRARGAFPRDVFTALGTFSVVPGVKKSSTPAFNGPEPHPLDFDWRFNRPTAAYIALEASRNGPVLCLGVPTVFQALVSKGARAVLVDRSLHAAEGTGQSGYDVVTKDVEDVEPSDLQSAYEVAVMDPPWYPDDYELWLARLLPLLRPGATFFTTLFPDLVRPSARSEQDQLCRRLHRLGRVRLLPRFAVYSTPPFEAEVLSRAGLGSLPEWRISPIVEVALGDGAHDRAPSGKARRGPQWRRFVIGQQTVAMVITPGSDAFSYIPGGEPFALNSVSRREPMRSRINVWTSRNWAAEVSGTETLDRFLGFVASGMPPELASQRAASADHEAHLLVRLLADLCLLK